MKIELSEQQYRDLIELLFLGNWVANATRTGAKGDEMIEKYEQLQDHILTFAEQFKADDVVIKEGSEYYTTMEFEEALMPLMEDYDDYVFWEQLASRLAKRDLLNEIGPVRRLTEQHRERMGRRK